MKGNVKGNNCNVRENQDEFEERRIEIDNVRGSGEEYEEIENKKI